MSAEGGLTPARLTDDQYLDRILTAQVYEVAIESPLELASGLSQGLGNRVLLKREDQQPTHSFKVRGAFNAVAQKAVALGPRDLPGVVAASAGNHAQGVALAAARLGLRAILVMPRQTPKIKVRAVISLGAEVELVGETFDEAALHAKTLAARRGFPFIHPFDDPDIIAGQGTIGLELCRQYLEPINALFVPVGGGGLLAGIAVALKRLRPSVLIIGVEPDDSDAMARSLRQGRRVRLDRVGQFADGVAVQQVGRETFNLCRRLVDEVMVVGTDAICSAMRSIFDDTRTVMEPAGALAVAGLSRYVSRTGCREETLVALTSGSNLDFGLLPFVVGRAEARSGHAGSSTAGHEVAVLGASGTGFGGLSPEPFDDGAGRFRGGGADTGC